MVSPSVLLLLKAVTGENLKFSYRESEVPPSDGSRLNSISRLCLSRGNLSQIFPKSARREIGGQPDGRENG